MVDFNVEEVAGGSAGAGRGLATMVNFAGASVDRGWRRWSILVVFLESLWRDPGDVLATGVLFFLGASWDGFWSDRGGLQMTFWPQATGFEVPRGPILSGFWSSRGGFHVTSRLRVGEVMVLG